MAQHIYDILKVTPYIRHRRSQLGVRRVRVCVCVEWGVEGGVTLVDTPAVAVLRVLISTPHLLFFSFFYAKRIHCGTRSI